LAPIFGSIIFLKELKMLLIYFLGISIVILLAFALSKETGKTQNTLDEVLLH